MFDREILKKCFVSSILIVILLTVTQCDKKSAPTVKLQTEILGVGIGMSRDEAERHLREVGQFERNERKNQQIWALPQDARYSRVALGFDSEDKVRYVTAFARAKGSTTQIQYQEFGDLKAARQNVFMANVEYVWEVPAQNDKPGFFVIIRGFDPTYALSASLMKSSADGKETDEDEDK